MKGCKPLFKLSTLGLIALISAQAYATGYKVAFQSVSVIAETGDAAVVDDASTNWYNSAGLVDLPTQLVSGGFDVYVRTHFSGTQFAPTPFGPPFDFLATGTSNSTVNSLLPNFHVSYSLNPNWALGLSVAPAFGFVEDYGRSAITRYDLTRVYTKTIMVSPSLSMRLDCHWSFGIGPDFHYFAVQSRNNVRTQGPFPLGTLNDSVNRFSADSWEYGAHAGVLYRFNPGTRIGLNYRTKITSHLSGRSTFLLDDITGFTNHHFKLKVPLPPVTSLGIYHELNPCWAVLANVNYEQWGVLRRYHGRNVSTPLGIVPNVVIPQDMHNAWEVGVGTRYRYSDRWLFRGAVKYLQNPTKAEFRDINFPDGPKLGVQVGARYTINKCFAVDGVIGHVFIKKVHVLNANPLTGSVLHGQVSTSVNFAGAALVWTI